MVLSLIEKEPMQDKFFLDTNVILYAYSSDDINKQKISQNIVVIFIYPSRL
jgi:predicted nucleic acid-binding protein